MLDMYQEKCLRGSDDENVAELERKVNEICNEMITKHDAIRAKYWQYVLNKFQLDMENAAQKAKESSASGSTA